MTTDTTTNPTNTNTSTTTTTTTTTGSIDADMWLYRWMSAIPALNYSAKVMVLAFIGTHIPLISLAVYFAMQSAPNWQTVFATVGITLLATLAGASITLYLLNQLLRPVLTTSRALRQYRETRQLPQLPTHYPDEVGSLMADAKLTIIHLDQLIDTLQYRDTSTGLANRKRFLQLLDANLTGDTTVSVIVIRFTNYARVAETLDSAAAERAAQTLGQQLQADAVVGDQIARVDTMHFASFIRPQTDKRMPEEDLAVRISHVLKTCAVDVLLDGITVSPVLRAGIANYPADSRDGPTLLDNAISATAQANDTTPLQLHSPQARQAVIHRFQLEQELRRALEHAEFELHYQPVVNAHADATIGAEALIRWRHPQRGLIAPSEFIPAAEATGLIAPIGLWVMRTACAQIRVWNDAGHDNLRTAINLSARQFMDPELARQVMHAVDANGISAHQLEIELTETAAMADHAHTRRMFHALRDIGVGIAIDDFGTGFASLSYLRKLPFDKLKIDREFVSDVHRIAHNQAICRALITLSKGLGLAVLAEGTESADEVSYLASQGCELFQGYYFSRPLTADLLSSRLGQPISAFQNLHLMD